MNTPARSIGRAGTSPALLAPAAPEAHGAAAAAASNGAGVATSHWRLMCMLLPARRFTAAELQRAAPEPPSRALKLAALFNVALPTLTMVMLVGLNNPLAFSLLLLALGGATLAALAVVWRDPSSRAVRSIYHLLPVLCVLLSLAVKRGFPEMTRDAHAVLGITLMLAAFGLWFAVVYRYQHIVMRLRELDERDRAIDMARQLASAQIQPHFLFNSLASLQHWVHTRDARAGPMLDSLTAYLRATLPLFEREHLSVAQEFEAVRRYLEVMQARLGERLCFELALQPEAAATAMPPGLLLTLIENAVEHGVAPQLSGGTVRVAAWREADGRTHVEVCDDGPGLPPEGLPASAGNGRGLGLRNTRERLAQAYGERASLQLGRAPGGGCVARLSLP